MIKPFTVTFGGFGRFIRRHFRVNPRRQRQRIDHDAFRPYPGCTLLPTILMRGGVRVFKLRFAHAAAVDRIGPLRAKRPQHQSASRLSLPLRPGVAPL